MQRISPGQPVAWTGFDDESEIYPEIASNSIDFPKEIYLTYAVCKKDCGNEGLIVEGNTDICEYCGSHMLRTVVGKYILSENQD